MRLKKLHIIGFKSFAEKTTLSFEAGITAVVGPNGCGKSNIADAFRWVLGEQSAKSMRGNKMPDVIFAGTTGRKPLNFAEVAITLTEIDGALPIEYEEITVMRRLHRSGESEYFLNAQPVRLKDLQSLFLDSGIGKNSFSIFEQGKIEQVIQFTPLERRYIFEEAAGILRFLQRKRETLRKLEQADSNIARIKDIHLEVEKQVVVLKEQAAKALVYKELRGTIGQLEKELLVHKGRQIEKRKSEALQQEDSQLQALLNLGENVASLEEQKNTLKERLETSENALKIQKEELFQVRSDKEIKLREQITVQERIKETRAKEKKWQLELEDLLEGRQHRQQELGQAKKQLQAAQQDISSLENSLKTQKEIVVALEAEVNQLHKQQKLQQQELVASLQSESLLDSEIKQNRVRLDGSRERQEQLKSRKEHLKTLESELRQQLLAKEKIVQESHAALEKQKTRLEHLNESVEEATREASEEQFAADKVQKEFGENKARFKALMRLREDMEGFSLASKRLLQESHSPTSRLHGKLQGLFELIQPSAGAEEAVASAMSRYSQTLVVKTAADADAVLAFVEAEQLTDFSLAVLELIPANPAPKTNGNSSLIPLSSLVAETSLSNHFLNQVFLAEMTSDRLALGEHALEGEVWCRDRVYRDRHAVFFYGTQGKNNAFLREAEIKGLEAEIQRLDALARSHAQNLKLLQEKRAQFHAEMVELDKNIRRHEIHQVEANFALQRLKGDLEKNLKESSLAESEISTLQSALEKQQELIASLEERYAQSKAKTAEVKAIASALEAEVHRKKEALSAQQALFQEIGSNCTGASELLQKSQHAIQLIELKESESGRQERRLEEELQLGQEFLSQMSSKSSEHFQILEKMEALLESATQACIALEETVLANKKQIQEVEATMAEILQRGKKQESEHHQIALLIAQLNAAYEGIQTELQERYHLSMAEALASTPLSEKSVDSMERRLRELRRDLEDSGDINMTSIDECAKHQVRYDFLNRQIEDLSSSKEGLLEIIRELDVESRKLFKETFEQISSNFKKNFALLFNGGEAELQFTENTDLLEAGIEIIAKPPGKQMRSINLLSGGEKCLTALALLFAIFEVKAGPFCILDEIDAPLDDSNVDRFANMVKQFTHHCQFIIITHNKQTMAIADRLFGVSMEEKGVSKLLQMELGAVPVEV